MTGPSRAAGAGAADAFGAGAVRAHGAGGPAGTGGGTEDDRIRDHSFVNGAWRDSITYSLLERERTPIGRADYIATPAGTPSPST